MEIERYPVTFSEELKKKSSTFSAGQCTKHTKQKLNPYL
jgi:hypothetical protein